MIHNIATGVHAFTSNAFLVVGDRTVLVDTGASFDAVPRIREYVDGLEAIVLTHTHPDHIGNLTDVREAFGSEVFGFDGTLGYVDRPITDDQQITMGNDHYIALHTPGHKDDHLCFFAPNPGILFVGDLIFENGGFGRTDLPEGDRDRLIESIDRVATVVRGSLRELHPGHGNSILSDPFAHVDLARQLAQTY